MILTIAVLTSVAALALYSIPRAPPTLEGFTNATLDWRRWRESMRMGERTLRPATPTPLEVEVEEVGT